MREGEERGREEREKKAEEERERRKREREDRGRQEKGASSLSLRCKKGQIKENAAAATVKIEIWKKQTQSFLKLIHIFSFFFLNNIVN